MTTNIYDQIAKTTGVSRMDVKRVLIAAQYSGAPPLPPKFPDSNAATQIAEEAFYAGMKATVTVVETATGVFHVIPREVRQRAWSEFEPSEAVKELIK